MYYRKIVLTLLLFDSNIYIGDYMIKRIVVAGCRNYNNYEEAKVYIEHCISRIKNEYTLIFVSGGCHGADQLGERFAKENNYKIERYPANWKKYGNSAGPIRNKQMADAGDYFICFWDENSNGTKSMINFAKALKKPIKIKII